jgi:type IV fimbrial biogenesis protein FimT
MSTMRTHRKAIAGFTLVEMMVVIIIMAVMLAWALPTYKQLITNYRMSDELSQINADVELARSTAVRTGSYVTICPSLAPTSSTPACSGANEWNTGWIVFTDNNNDQTIDASHGDVLLRAHIGMTGGDTLLSVVTASGNAANTITFNNMGGTTAWGAAPSSGSIVLNDSTNDLSMIRCLTISEAGMIVSNTPASGTQASCP